MTIITDIVNIFIGELNYEQINRIGDVKMRNHKNGIQLNDLIYYKFLYSKEGITKERTVSIINNINGTNFTRQAFEGKENNVPIKTYTNILDKISSLYNRKYCNKNNPKLIGIDGTYNLDSKRTEIMNLGFYDITNAIPIDVYSCGIYSKNKEVYFAQEYIKNNLDIFKGNIIVVDRGYFSYDFINFLIENGLKFIIRVKGNAINLKPKKKLRKSFPKYKRIMNIRKSARIVEYTGTIKKVVYGCKSKKKPIKKHIIDIKNDCIIVTNLLDKETYTDKKILDLYRSRWDIEVFFKYLKTNYRFRNIKEKSSINYKKMFICELIITYLAKIIEKYYMKNNPLKESTKDITYKINKSNLINGIFDCIIYKILNKTLTKKILDQFCISYVKVIRNKNNRTFPRTSKTPFTKWYAKGYSCQTKFIKIINAVINQKIDKLNKNEKVIANKILTINGKEYG